jgi:hypothetical protein
MKKIKWTLMTLVILLSIGAAFAFRTAKLQSGLYYWNGSEYEPAGTMGVTYYCATPSSAVCVYSYSDGVYSPYITSAVYTPIAFNAKTNPAVKKDK